MSAVIEDTSEYAGVIYYLHDGDYMPRYIGQTTQPLRKRFQDHKYEARSGRTDSPLYRWMRKHGDAVQICSLELFTAEDLHMIDSREVFHIAQWREYTVKPNLNLSEGGESGCRGCKWTPEQRARQSAAQSGKALAEEHRARIAVANTGRVFTESHRANISAARAGRAISEAHQSKLKGTGNHTRWHVNRNIIKPECEFCKEGTVNG